MALLVDEAAHVRVPLGKGRRFRAQQEERRGQRGRPHQKGRTTVAYTRARSWPGTGPQGERAVDAHAPLAAARPFEADADVVAPAVAGRPARPGHAAVVEGDEVGPARGGTEAAFDRAQHHVFAAERLQRIAAQGADTPQGESALRRQVAAEAHEQAAIHRERRREVAPSAHVADEPAVGGAAVARLSPELERGVDARRPGRAGAARRRGRAPGRSRARPPGWGRAGRPRTSGAVTSATSRSPSCTAGLVRGSRLKKKTASSATTGIDWKRSRRQEPPTCTLGEGRRNA